jgi:NADPH:quinone reductase-like Zn-dependent oxidoreductase
LQTWITALQALYFVGHFKSGESVLWHAGASSVSIAGAQLAKLGGAKSVFATVGSQEKVDFCTQKLGVTAAFNYRSQNWAAEIQQQTQGKGVDVIVDFIGANYFQDNLKTAALNGRIVQLALLSGATVSAGLDISPILRKRVRIEGSTLRSRDVNYQGKLRDLLVEIALPKFIDGSLRVYVEKVFRFEEIVDAHKLMEQNTTKGKIICVI